MGDKQPVFDSEGYRIGDVAPSGSFTPSGAFNPPAEGEPVFDSGGREIGEVTPSAQFTSLGGSSLTDEASGCLAILAILLIVGIPIYGLIKLIEWSEKTAKAGDKGKALLPWKIIGVSLGLCALSTLGLGLAAELQEWGEEQQRVQYTQQKQQQAQQEQQHREAIWQQIPTLVKIEKAERLQGKPGSSMFSESAFVRLVVSNNSGEVIRVGFTGSELTFPNGTEVNPGTTKEFLVEDPSSAIDKGKAVPKGSYKSSITTLCLEVWLPWEAPEVTVCQDISKELAKW